MNRSIRWISEAKPLRITLLAMAAIVASLLTLSAPNAASAKTITFDGTITGSINGQPLSAIVSGSGVSGGTKSVSLAFSDLPSGFHPAHSAGSLFSVNTGNFCAEVAGALNFNNVLGGTGTYSYDRLYTFPGYPGSFLTASGAATLLADPNSLTFTGNWTGDTASLPSDIVEIRPYQQTFVPLGSGVASVSGSAKLVTSTNEVITTDWSGSYDFGPGNDFPFPQVHRVSQTFTFDGSTMEMDLLCTMQDASVGGTAELLTDDPAASASSAGSAGDSTLPVAAAAGGLLVALAGGGWFVRRRSAR